MKGRVKFYNTNKGYGFITDEFGTNIFFHISDVVSGVEPNSNDLAEFDVESTKKGNKAVNIKVHMQPERFIKLGETRIRYSDIKEYCIDNKFDIKYKENMSTTRKVVLAVGGVLSLLSKDEMFLDVSSTVADLGRKTTKVEYKVMRVVTRHNKEFIFDQKSTDFDLEELLNDLDSYFGVIK